MYGIHKNNFLKNILFYITFTVKYFFKNHIIIIFAPVKLNKTENFYDIFF